MTEPELDLTGIERVVVDAVIEEFRVGDGIHGPTAIAAAAATAGTLLLREAVGDLLDTFEPGSAIITDEVNETGPELLGWLIEIANGAGIEWDNSGEDVAEDDAPNGAYVDLVRRMEPIANELLREFDRGLWPRICALAAFDLVLRAQDVLAPAISTRLVSYSLVNGAKTVPYPLT